MREKLKIGSPVVVTWEDAWQTEGYATPEEMGLAEPKLLESSGFILRKDKRALALGMDKLPDGRYRDIKYIPLGMLVKVKALR